MENNDLNGLNKHQLILLTFLITFVVSIATGIVTVSLMNQAPKSVPYTINNVIQRTIEKVITTSSDETNETDETDDVTESDNIESQSVSVFSENDILVGIYEGDKITESKLLGEGVLISDLGLVLVDTDVLNKDYEYTISLDNTLFGLKTVKSFDGKFSILQIVEKEESNVSETQETENDIENDEDSIGNSTE